MLFSDCPRTHYDNAPVHEVICQLRFPTILSINNNEPADFQERVRAHFPQYSPRQDVSQPRITEVNGDKVKVEQPPSVTNYHFYSEDGVWKLNLTKDFVALSTLRYTGWEEFASQLDRALAAFIELYKPAYFQRVGLRYMNIFSRARLGLEDASWSELIAPAYLGPMAEADAVESNFYSCAFDIQCKLDSSCMAKIHAGPGRLKNANPKAPEDTEIKYIFDMDLSMSGNVACTLSAAALETLHGHAGRIFEGALTDTLRDAMSNPF